MTLLLFINIIVVSSSSSRTLTKFWKKYNDIQYNSTPVMCDIASVTAHVTQHVWSLKGR